MDKIRLFFVCLLLLGAIALRPTQADPVAIAHFQDCPNCPKMVIVPAGHFEMGSPTTEAGRFDSEGPTHLVTVQRFALSETPVTIAEFADFVQATGRDMGNCAWPSDMSWRPSLVTVDSRQPVVCVSWQDAQAYVAWLNQKVGGKPNYRLPSEAEWEYAARAGTMTARWWGDAIETGWANCNGCGSPWDNRMVAPAGSFQANAFGLRDMLGNVWQWVADCWHDSYVNAPNDGSAWVTGDCQQRVVRGGSWSNLSALIRSASRSHGAPTDRDADYASYTGFRVARSVPPS